MAPPRTFDYDLLKKLVRERPELPYSDYADELTADARRTDPNARRVLPDSVRRVVSQYRAQWEEEGITIPARGVVHADLLPPLATLAPSQRMSTPLRYLRELSKERRGDAPASDYERTIRGQAIRWEARLRENLEVVDVTELGIVEVRPARADEIGSDGRLIEIAAWAIHGWERKPRQNMRGRG
jgi:hypothetical protein